MTVLLIHDVADALHAKFPAGNFKNPLKWSARCYEVASAMVKAKVVKGTAVYGHWLGAVEPGTPFAGRPLIQHGWVLQKDSTVVDPTRWVFEGRAPYIWTGKESEGSADICGDFVPLDEADSLCEICTCMHAREEHRSGFFRPCRFCVWPYDEGGNSFKALTRKPYPVRGPKEETEPLNITGTRARMVLLGLVPHPHPTRTPHGYHLTFPQMMWLANTPYDELGGEAFNIYRAFKQARHAGLIPIDNYERAQREHKAK